MRATLNLTVAATLCCLVSSGCNREAPPVPPPIATAPRPVPTATAPAPAAMATATLSALGTSGVSGSVTFTDTGNGVSVEAHLTGLTPGKHGFHVHQVGDCSGDGTAAGDHFNPAASPHGGPDGEVHHAGDMGNVEADATGTAHVTMLMHGFTLDSNETTGIVGRSVVVHEKEDDLTSQPAGNSGTRIACGVIAMSTAAAMPAEGAMPATSAPMGSMPEGTTAPAGASAP